MVRLVKFVHGTAGGDQHGTPPTAAPWTPPASFRLLCFKKERVSIHLWDVDPRRTTSCQESRSLPILRNPGSATGRTSIPKEKRHANSCALSRGRADAPAPGSGPLIGLEPFTDPVLGIRFIPAPGGCFEFGDTFGTASPTSGPRVTCASPTFSSPTAKSP